MIEPLPAEASGIVGFRFSGTLHDADYRIFVPALAGGGKVRLLIVFDDFHGWDLHAAWDDFKVGMTHYADFERIAVVGDNRLEAVIATFLKPFTQATVRYFDKTGMDAARAWLREGR